MKKIKGLGFLGVLSVLTVVLFLAGGSFMQAQDNEDTWAVRIPTQTEAADNGLMLYGMEGADGTYLYENNGTTIEVTVQKNSISGPWNRYYDFVYKFNFKLTNDNLGTGAQPTNYVGFQNVTGLYEVTYPDDDKDCCQFPDTSYASSPGNCQAECMAEFLNNIHPYSDGVAENGYQFFQYQITVYDQDIESMSSGEIYTLGTSSDPGEPGDLLGMAARYREGCYEEPTYHDVEFYRSINYWRACDNNNALNMVIIKLDSYDIECDGAWRMLVYPGDYPDDGIYAGEEAYLRVKERYCTEERNKSTWVYPMQAKGNFHFYVDFIKNPGTSTEPEPEEPPAAPSDLGATAIACDQIDLTWSDNSDNESGFEIERTTDGQTFTVSANTTSYTDNINLNENTTYSYRVRAYNDAGYSDYSNEASATTPECVAEAPAAPTGLTAKQPGRSPKVVLKWNDNSTNEDGFRIYRTIGSTTSMLIELGPNTTSYEDTTFTSGETYTYQVCAYNSSGESCSSTVEITTK
ncbi:MAG: fibronectin type III domain-containing protein [Acidobacteriota bacterium]